MVIAYISNSNWFKRFDDATANTKCAIKNTQEQYDYTYKPWARRVNTIIIIDAHLSIPIYSIIWVLFSLLHLTFPTRFFFSTTLLAVFLFYPTSAKFRTALIAISIEKSEHKQFYYAHRLAIEMGENREINWLILNWIQFHSTKANGKFRNSNRKERNEVTNGVNL